MGAGDELMAMGRAQEHYERTGQRVVVIDVYGNARWHEAWDAHPAIVHPDRAEHGHHRLLDAPFARPYITSWVKEPGGPRAIYNDWRVRDHLGRMHLRPEELRLGRELAAGGPFAVVEPRVKRGASPNKDWGVARYQRLLALLPQVRFVQMGPEAEPDPMWKLRGAQYVQTPSFRDACGVLAAAAGYVGPEGGMSHAAAALRRPAVVIFGSYVSPMTTGYPFHWNLTGMDGLAPAGRHAPCGRWAPCDDCARALASIRPEDVAEAVGEMLQIEPVPVPRGDTTHAL